MTKFNVTGSTTFRDLQNWAQQQPDGDKIRGKLLKDGSIQLYSSAKGPGHFSFSTTREAKRELARNALTSLFKKTSGSDFALNHILTRLTGNRSSDITGDKLKSMIAAAFEQGRMPSGGNLYDITPESLATKNPKELSDLLSDLDAMKKYPLSSTIKARIGQAAGTVKTRLQEKLTGLGMQNLIDRSNNVRPSSSGSGGIIFMEANPGTTDMDLVLKPDPPKGQDTAERMSKAVDQIRRNWPDCPLDVPCHARIDINANPGDRARFMQKLGQVRDQFEPDSAKYKTLQRQIDRMNGQGLGGHQQCNTILAQEKVNGRPLNEVSVARRTELLTSPDFAVNFGKATPLAMILGFNDHTLPTGQSNWSNFFLTEGNSLVFGDLDAGAILSGPGEDTGKIGTQNVVLTTQLTAMKTIMAPGRNFLQDAGTVLTQTPGDFENGAQKFFHSILKLSGEDSFFTEQTQLDEANQSMTENDKKKVYLNYVKGALQGVKEVLDHKEQIMAALKADGIKIGEDPDALFTQLTQIFDGFDFGTAGREIDAAIATLG